MEVPAPPVAVWDGVRAHSPAPGGRGLGVAADTTWMRTFTALVSLVACLTVAPAALAHNGPHGLPTGRWPPGTATLSARASVRARRLDGVVGLIPVEMDSPRQAGQLAGKRVSVRRDPSRQHVGRRRGRRSADRWQRRRRRDGDEAKSPSSSSTSRTTRSQAVDDHRSSAGSSSTTRLGHAYYQDASVGQLSMSGDVTVGSRFPMTTLVATTAAGAALARTAAPERRRQPVELHEHRLRVADSQASCGWAGLAYLPGRDSWINGSMSCALSATSSATTSASTTRARSAARRPARA